MALATANILDSVYLIKDSPTDKVNDNGWISLVMCKKDLRRRLNLMGSSPLSNSIMDFAEKHPAEGILALLRDVLDRRSQRVGVDIYIHKYNVDYLCTILPEPSLRLQFRILNPAVDKKEGSDETILEKCLELPVLLKECIVDANGEAWAKCHRSLPGNELKKGKQVTCDVILEWTGSPNPKPITMESSSFGNNLLSREASKDLTIVAGNGAEVKCHSLIFTAHSEVLAVMLSAKTGMTESKTLRVEMRENSEEGLTRLIRYFYGLELTTADLTCDVAVELLKTAHKYKLAQLVESLIRIFLVRDCGWFTANDLVEMYFHAKNLEDSKEWKELMDHSLQMMLSFYLAIKTCERFLEIQGTDVRSATELIWKLFEMVRGQNANRKTGE